ncbi:MAG: rhodanese-like domain-containing protein [Methylomonas sp.]|jgi:thiosulfate sulfurtransferase
MKKFKTIQVKDAKQLITDAQPLILDCRNLKDYQAGHIDNAMHVHEQLRDSLLRKGEKQKPLLIYCYHGHASEHLAEMFGDFGFKEVYSLTGGYAEWQQHSA